MKVTKNSLTALTSVASFAHNGDVHEQQLGNLVVPAFPEVEMFWKSLIVPLTERILGYPNGLTPGIRMRPEVAPELHDWAQSHYSIFLGLAYAHLHRLAGTRCQLEDFYSHLGTTCDLVEEFLETTFLLLANAQQLQVQVLQSLSEAEFLDLAKKWYTKNYNTLFDHYKQRRQMPPISPIGKTPLVKEFLATHLQRPDLWKRWARLTGELRPMRNVLVHRPQLGRLIQHDGKVLIPAPRVVTKYRSWRSIFGATQDQIKKDFVLAEVQMCTDIARMSEVLNQIWEPVRTAVEDELFHGGPTLRAQAALEF